MGSRRMALARSGTFLPLFTLLLCRLGTALVGRKGTEQGLSASTSEFGLSPNARCGKSVNAPVLQESFLKFGTKSVVVVVVVSL